MRTNADLIASGRRRDIRKYSWMLVHIYGKFSHIGMPELPQVSSVQTMRR